MMRALNLPFTPGTDAAMTQSTRLLFLLSMLPAASKREDDEHALFAPPALPAYGPELDHLVANFLDQAITPSSTFDFERQLQLLSREHCRTILAAVYNAAAARVDAADARVHHDGDDYRRLNRPTRNQHVATLFGTITLERHMYRSCDKDSGLPCLSPAEMVLGLMQGVTPAFAEAATRYFAEAGATQASVLARLHEQHGVAMGAERLRDLAAQRAAAVAEAQTDRCADRVLELLKQADASSGRHKPVLSVGRDGVTLCEYRYRFFEVASVGTIAVFDRRDQRLGTVYLGCVPEPNQPTLSARLTAVIAEVLRRWQGPLPRLCYVTDAGDNETNYYREVLRPMRHPRTDERLAWVRVLDFYHVMERVWTMSKALFGKDERAGAAWARRLGKLLKKPNGAFRVLHAAAAMASRRGMSKARQADYAKAYEYMRKRTKWMRYHDYKRVGIPLGSGVTEAACKTLVAQRLKLSGMRWKKPGAQVILDLRAELLSGTWEAANRQILATRSLPKVRTPAQPTSTPASMAA
jgi:hypothetical protein